MKATLVAAALLLTSLSAPSALQLNIKGEVESVTETQVVIRTKTAIYRLQRSKLSKEDQQALQKGSSASISVSNDAVDEVRPREDRDAAR